MTGAGATVQLFWYAGAGDLFTDPGTPGHDEQAAALAWDRRTTARSGSLKFFPPNGPWFSSFSPGQRLPDWSA